MALLLACFSVLYQPGGALHADDDQSVRELLGTALACSVTELLLADMPVDPLYQFSGAACTSVDPRDAEDDTLFSDADCQQPVAFKSTGMPEYCAAAVDAESLGNAADIASPVWTLSPGSQIDVGARPLENVIHPYMQRVVYRQVETPQGSCQLEMRVYARHPAISGQRSLLALHGGSWSSRGFGFFGLELTIPHLVESGFVVYAPFYRLLGSSDGSVACNDSSIGEIVTDASAALDWLIDNASQYGSNGLPVVFGQSAGGHLAASLMIDRAESVSAAVLFYPPTDFTDFLLRAQMGLYDNQEGIGILQLLLGKPAAEADAGASPVPENSFPQRIVGNTQTLPPVFMLHGMADELVEARQSSRLCDALADRSLPAVDENTAVVSSLRDVRSCSPATDAVAGVTPVPGSTLHLIREGLHALDICLESTLLPTEICRSGSEASRQLVAESIGDAMAFAVAAVEATVSTDGANMPDDNSAGEGGTAANETGTDAQAQASDQGGSGSLFGILLLLMISVAMRWFGFSTFSRNFSPSLWIQRMGMA